VNMLRQVYRNTFGGSERQRDDDMGDEIPHQVTVMTSPKRGEFNDEIPGFE